MGGPKGTRPYLLKQYCHDCVMQPTAAVTLLDQADYPCLVDALTELYTITGKDSEYFMSGSEFYRRVLEGVEREWQAGAEVVVLSCDFQPNVPIEKSDTQADRSNKGEEPYPDAAVVSANGILDVTECDEVMRFDTRRLMASRQVRVSLYHYIHSEFLQLAIPKGKALILEFQDEQVHYYGSEKQQRALMEYRHHHGEGEVSVWFWAQLYYKKKVIKIKSSDTDEIVAFLAYVENTSLPKATDIIWQYYDKTQQTYVYIDMLKLAHGMLTRARLTAAQWCLYWGLGGCDYLPKKLCTNNFGLPAILAAIAAATPIAATTFTTKGREDDTSGLECILRYLYSSICVPTLTKSGSKRKLSAVENQQTADEQTVASFTGPPLMSTHSIRVYLATTSSKRYVYPSEQTLAFANTRLRFLVRYWTRNYQLVNPIARHLVPPALLLTSSPCDSLCCQSCTQSHCDSAAFIRCVNCSRPYCKNNKQCQQTTPFCSYCNPTLIGDSTFYLSFTSLPVLLSSSSSSSSSSS